MSSMSSDIPGVREDVIQVMLKVKQLRMILHDVDTSHLHIEVKGAGVTGADIQLPAEIEIMNPNWTCSPLTMNTPTWRLT